MGCWHGWHGCGPWYASPYVRRWYGPDEWDELEDRPMPRRSRRGWIDREAAAEDLEGRLEELRTELRRAEAELAELRGVTAAAAESR